MMSEKTEADEIEELIVGYGWLWAEFVMTNNAAKDVAREKRKDLMDRIRSIISERDALRAAMQSHRKELR